MRSHSTAVVIARGLAVATLTGAAGLLMFAGRSSGVAEPPRDPLTERLARVVEQRDALAVSVAELEWRLRNTTGRATRSDSAVATVASRWVEQGAGGGFIGRRLCARIVEIGERDGPMVPVAVAEVCGELRADPTGDGSVTSLESLMKAPLFACWVDAAARAEMPPCLPVLTEERARWNDVQSP